MSGAGYTYTPAAGVPDVINVTAPVDPCGFVFPQADKAAGGTLLEWIEYRMCQVGNLAYSVVSAPGSIYTDITAAYNALAKRLNDIKNQIAAAAGQISQAIQDKMQQLYNDAGALLAAAEDSINRGLGKLEGYAVTALTYVEYAAIGIGAIIALWLLSDILGD